MSIYRIVTPTTFSLTALLWTSPLLGEGEPRSRVIPTPLPDHPGNVFLSGQEVTIPVPESAASCRLLDYDGNLVSQIAVTNGKAALGKLPVGFFRLDLPGASNSISLGVISSLQAPTPSNSPIGIDVAMAWFYEEDRMAAVANLCALAGVNWVRDRLNWAQMESQKGQFAASNRYDASALAQSRAGLRVLQVIHLSPHWANPNPKRFPLDLRDGYRFYEAMARRWRGQVQAFEPWNEADIPMFGGHTGSEMAALQKAAYLGLKAGNPEIVACLNVFALHNRSQLEDLDANESWPYFDTFNLHHYAPFDEYPKLYADFRAVSAGRPLWVSECSLPVKWAGSESLKEPTDADQKVQAERVAKTFACSLHEGAAATFYFMLPHYIEGQTQFGILRSDLTPRPAYVALAAVGRLLARAEPIGRLNTTNSTVRAFLVRAMPDGRPQEVLVAWTTQTNASFALPVQPVQVLDHLGRLIAAERELTLSRAPLFAVLPLGAANALSFTAPPAKPPMRQGKACPIVLQALWPDDKLDLKRSAYRVPTQKAQIIPVYAYNFGSSPVRGSFGIEQSSAWKAEFPNGAQIGPGERIELPLTVTSVDSASDSPASVRIIGDFGAESRPILSVRLVPLSAGPNH
jgi:hypothetical protein